MLTQKLKSNIRDVVDFPKKGIVFKDITPIMMNPLLSKEILHELVKFYEEKNITKIVGIESRGFLFGFPLAIELGIPFVLIRKKGKLPYNKTSFDYELEYGVSTIEMHTDAITSDDHVLIHDDLLATGGSAAAAASLIEQAGGKVFGFSFLVELDFLEGRKKITPFNEQVHSLVHF
ncbi:MAG: adenine phosphoribosyltransferase [Flavobacteriia bacterium]|nr:adenine phosphoribosyltransferase [Flavobacteriia bacterium]